MLPPTTEGYAMAWTWLDKKFGGEERKENAIVSEITQLHVRERNLEDYEYLLQLLDRAQILLGATEHALLLQNVIDRCPKNFCRQYFSEISLLRLPRGLATFRDFLSRSIEALSREQEMLKREDKDKKTKNTYTASVLENNQETITMNNQVAANQSKPQAAYTFTKPSQGLLN